MPEFHVRNQFNLHHKVKNVICINSLVGVASPQPIRTVCMSALCGMHDLFCYDSLLNVEPLKSELGYRSTYQKRARLGLVINLIILSLHRQKQRSMTQHTPSRLSLAIHRL